MIFGKWWKQQGRERVADSVSSLRPQRRQWAGLVQRNQSLDGWGQGLGVGVGIPAPS